MRKVKNPKSKKKSLLKIEGSSLFYVLIISFLIGILTSSFILKNHFDWLVLEQSKSRVRLIDNCESGLALLKSEFKLNQFGELNTDLFGNQSDSVFLKRVPWGLLDVIHCVAHIRSDSVQKTQLIGDRISSSDHYALYLANSNRPLSLCGHTRIKGTAYVPEAGVKRVFIEGQTYTGDQLIYGAQKQSNRSVPDLDFSSVKKLRDLQDGKFEFNHESLLIDDLIDRKLEWDFLNPTKIIHIQDSLNLEHFELSGNVIVFSSRPIRFHNSCVLNDIIVVAPKIYIDSLSEFTAQFIAEKRIHVGSNSKLKFPSNLIVQNEKEESEIWLDKNAHVEGNIILNSQNQKESLVSIEQNSLINGQVYSSGYSELKGDIHGSLTSQFVSLTTYSSKYVNHLLGTQIASFSTDEEHAGVSFLGNELEKLVLKELK